MFAQRIFAVANVRKAVPISSPLYGNQRNLVGCFFTTTTSSSGENDPAAKLLDGSVKMRDLSTRELQAALDHRGRYHGDCLDRESLGKRLADTLLNEHNSDRVVKEMRQKLGGAEAGASLGSFDLHLVMNTPWLPFALSKDLTGSNNNPLVLVPPWEVDRVRANFVRCGSVWDPSVAAREHQLLVNHRVGLDRRDRNSLKDAKLGTAALLLQLHGDNDDVHELERGILLDETKFMRYTPVITCLNPVPKNWTLDDEILIDKTAETKENVALAIGCAHHLAGERDAIQDLDKFRKHNPYNKAL